jgi:hypothetical protein
MRNEAKATIAPTLVLIEFDITISFLERIDPHSANRDRLRDPH